MNPTLRLVFVSVIFIVLSACTRGCGKEKVQAVDDVYGGASEISLAIWSNYLAPDTLETFKKETGITVRVSNFSSNEELLAKIQAGGSGFDVIVPSDYMVATMIQLELLSPLKTERLGNFIAVSRKFLKKSYDVQNQYSVPFDLGFTGLAVRTDQVKSPISSWKDFFEMPELAGKISMLDDPRESIGAALKSLKLSLNDTGTTELAKAKEVLLKARPRIKAFSSETLQMLVDGEVAVAHAYSSDAMQARQKTGGKVDFILPKEGYTVWIDNLAIPVTSEKKDAAHAFINFMLNASVQAQIASAIFVAPSVPDALSLLPKELGALPLLSPGPEQISRGEMLEDAGDAAPAFDKVWTEVRAE